MTDERTALLRALSATAYVHTIASLSACHGGLMSNPGKTRRLLDRLCDEGLVCRYEPVRGKPGAVHGDYFYEITRAGIKAFKEEERCSSSFGPSCPRCVMKESGAWTTPTMSRKPIRCSTEPASI